MIEGLKRLFDDMDKFYRSMDEQYQAGAAVLRRRGRWFRKIMSGGIGFVLGVVASIVAGYLTDWLPRGLPQSHTVTSQSVAPVGSELKK